MHLPPFGGGFSSGALTGRFRIDENEETHKSHVIALCTSVDARDAQVEIVVNVISLFYSFNSSSEFGLSSLKENRRFEEKGDSGQKCVCLAPRSTGMMTSGNRREHV